MSLETLSEQPQSQVSPNGSFPSWVAFVAMLIFPLIGVFIVALTTWRLRLKVIVGICGSILWIVAAGLTILFDLGGPTGPV
jgi:hypothetical protein